mgnify:CR=1 FL=1
MHPLIYHMNIELCQAIQNIIDCDHIFDFDQLLKYLKQ